MLAEIIDKLGFPKLIYGMNVGDNGLFMSYVEIDHVRF